MNVLLIYLTNLSTGVTKKELTNVEKQEQTASFIYYSTEFHHFLTLQ